MVMTVKRGTKDSNFEFPRRNCVDQYIPAEKAISDLVAQVEALGAHPRLTDAVTLLHQAKDAVADWAEETGNLKPDNFN